jgi:hypothetical protein
MVRTLEDVLANRQPAPLAGDFALVEFAAALVPA